MKLEVAISSYTPQGDFYGTRERSKGGHLYIGRAEAESGLVFEGFDLPIHIDPGIPSTEGNGCFNLVTEGPEDLKTFIQEKCLNLSGDKYPKIRWRYPSTTKPLFPDWS